MSEPDVPDSQELDEILDNDSEFQEWLKSKSEENRESLIQFYDVWEVE